MAYLDFMTADTQYSKYQWRAQEFFFFGGGGGGVQPIQLRTEGRENGDLGVVVP
jgi:hypothetical protein